MSPRNRLRACMSDRFQTPVIHVSSVDRCRVCIPSSRYLFAEVPVRVARDRPHVFAVLALEPEQIAFGVGGRKRRTAVAVAFRAMLPAIVVRRGLGIGHPGTNANYGSASSGNPGLFR